MLRRVSVCQNLTVRSLHLFADYLFYEILELLDLDLKPTTDVCSRFHFLPRFVRDLPGLLIDLCYNKIASFKNCNITVP